MGELVTVDLADGVADVRLNRAGKYNALNLDMFAAIIDAGERLAATQQLRAVVLSGNGRGFCAGIDMSSLEGLAEGEAGGSRLFEKEPGRPDNFAQRAAYVWKRMPVPVIAALHGVAYGGGCQLALGADIRFAAPDARLSVMEIRWGLVPDMSITQTLRSLVGMDVAKELVFTGRALSGEEALALGLVTHVADDPLAAATELAHEIAVKSPDAVRAAKKLLEESWHADESVGLALETELQLELIGSANQLEAVNANVENRPARFSDH